MRWDFKTGIDPEAYPIKSVMLAVGDGLVYVGASNGLVYALDARTGAERWRVEPPWVVSFPVVEDGRVIVGNNHTEMYEPGVEYTGLDRRSSKRPCRGFMHIGWVTAGTAVEDARAAI